jgi:hypothetical protein
MADGPSLPGIDVAALLAPIAPGAPTGVDLRKQPKSIFLEIEGLLDGKGVPDVIVADSEGRKSSLRDERALSQSVIRGSFARCRDADQAEQRSGSGDAVCAGSFVRAWLCRTVVWAVADG